MLYTIENDHFKATLNDLGAELTTLTGKADGYEYIWCGDPAVWSGHSPVLFPFVGKLKDGGFNYQGKRYKMTKHGFARGTVFTVTEQAADRIVFTFDDWQKNYEGFPFRYILTVTYQLTEKGIRFTYAVQNIGDEVMYTSLGAHPAINAVDARLEFPCKETLDAMQFGPDGLRKDELTPFLNDSATFQVLPHTFDDDSYSLEGLKSA